MARKETQPLVFRSFVVGCAVFVRVVEENSYGVCPTSGPISEGAYPNFVAVVS